MNFLALMQVKILKKNHLIKNISTIVRGTVIGQGLVFLLSPIITRIYTPQDFGIYTIYFSLLSILATICTLRFDVAIPIPKKKIEAFSLAFVALISLIFFSLGTAILNFFFGHSIASLLKAEALDKYLWIMPFSILAYGIYYTLTYLLIRQRQFPTIGNTKIIQGVSLGSTQILIGLLNFKPLGLILGQAAGHLTAATTFIYAICHTNQRTIRRIKPCFLIACIRRYQRFPLLSMPASLINALGLFLPALAVSAIYGPKIAGWYGLATQVIGVPLGLIGQAIGQVYLGEGAALKNKGQYQALNQLYKKTMRQTFFLGLPFIMLTALLGPNLFGLVFGSEWSHAGVFARVLSAMFLLEFSIIGVSQNFSIFERQEMAVYWNLIFIVLNFLAFIPAVIFNISPIWTIFYLSLAKSIGYITMAFLNLYVLKDETIKLNQSLCVE